MPQALPGDGVQQERDTGDDLAVMIRVADRHAELLPVPYFHVVFTGTLSG